MLVGFCFRNSLKQKLNLFVIMKKSSVARPPQFDEWIDMYAGDKFEASVNKYIALVDAACKTADNQTFEAMKRHFQMSCKLEYMFWDQAQDQLQWPAIA